jgi:hypothetical protein
MRAKLAVFNLAAALCAARVRDALSQVTGLHLGIFYTSRLAILAKTVSEDVGYNILTEEWSITDPTEETMKSRYKIELESPSAPLNFPFQDPRW